MRLLIAGGTGTSGGDLTTAGVLRFPTGVRGECTLDQWLTGVR